jgi:hypothetical protein
MPETMLRYKYVPSNNGSLNIIKDGTIKFTHPKNFNDPFDCYPEVDKQELSKTFVRNNGIFRKLCDERGLSPAQRLLEKPKHRRDLQNSLKRVELLARAAKKRKNLPKVIK